MSHITIVRRALVLCLTLGTAPVLAEGTAVVDTPSFHLAVDPATRSISSLVARAGERNFIAPAGGPLYAILFADNVGPVNATDAVEIKMRIEGRTIFLVARHIKPFEFAVQCRFEPAEGQIRGRIAITSPQAFRLAAVTFPIVAIKLPLSGTGENDALIAPYCDGQLIRDPFHNRTDMSMNYPGAASMQFIAATDQTAGVYLAARDSEGCAKVLSFARRGNAQEMSIRHLPAQTPVKEWALPYDVAITTFEVPAGAIGWEVAAEIYRQWAQQQPWCARTVRQRVESGDIPAWLVEPSLFYAFSLGGQLADKSQGNRLALVPEQARAWREALGGPVTFMPMSWEKMGAWVTPDYFPPFGGTEAFGAMTRQLHQDGHHALVFLSGLKWTLHKARPGPDGKPGKVIDQQAEFERRGAGDAISDAARKPLIAGKLDQDVGQYAQICPTTPLAARILLGAVKGCQELGIDCVQADQLVGGGSPPCFHPDHRHPPGGGNWSARALYDLFERMRREGRMRDKNFAFAIEEPGEFFLPVLDTCHTRDYQQNRWPRSGKASLGVPLFTHVYHEYLHGYGGDSAYVSPQPSDVANYHQAMNLVCGKAPAVAVWTRWFDPTSIDVTQRRMLRSHFELWRGEGKEFLVYGRRLATPSIEVPTMPITFTDKDPKKDKRAIEVPVVLHSAWRAADGRKAVVYASIAAKPVTFTAAGQTITLAPGEAVVKVMGAQGK